MVEKEIFIHEPSKPRYLSLGLDLGIASCGFALLDLNNCKILEMGSRLFEAPVVPKTGQSKAAVRRGFRSTRRNLDRTQNRLAHCLGLLEQEGIVPQGAGKEYFHTVKGDLPPLVLRVSGLDRTLTDREWAIVLYSLCKRRGYIPHGEGSDTNAEDGKVLKALSMNAQAFEESGFRTVGEWLAAQPRSRNRAGQYDKCVTHAQLVNEVRTLFATQRAQGSAHASEDLEARYLEIFSWESPRADFDECTYQRVGNCLYFPKEKRAARCTLTSELVAAYGALGNVSIIMPDGSKRTLTAGERDRYIATLFSSAPIKGNKDCKVTFAHIRKDLDLPARTSFTGIRADDEKNREVYRPQGWRALRSTLGPDNPELLNRLRDNRDLADAVLEAAAYSSSADVLRSQLETLNLSEGEVKALCRLPYSSRALNGYGTRSKKALDLLLEMFEEPEVCTLTDAENACGLDEKRLGERSIACSDRLIPYSTWLELTGRTNNNPVVLRAMAQMRKVVNAICRTWGVPNEIHVELSRDLRLSKRAKDDIAKNNRRNEKNNERIAGQIAELLSCAPNEVKGSLIAKWRLWEEQDNRDMYTGEAIDPQRLVSDSTYVQVDHVLPFSRTGDNSSHNKVLVLARSNQHKRERTPYEWMVIEQGNDAPSWNEFEARVLENHKLSQRKRLFLLEKDLDAKSPEFINRNLNDTSYMSREACAYLSDCLAFPNDGNKAHLVPVKGTATAWLRHAWGLNFGLRGEKDRSDDRHHATDACVIAACSRSIVIKTARLSSRGSQVARDERDSILAEAMPWPTFAADVRARRESVIPTRFVPHRGSGEIFEQTIYAYLGTNNKGKDLVGKGRNKRRKGDVGQKVMGNAVVSADGKSAIKVSEMICLRLWHDPTARKRRGQWYADPIYRADLPALKDKSYVPRIAKAHVGRKQWAPIPPAALGGVPVEIYLGDALRVGNDAGRFAGFDIGGARWTITNVLTGEELSFPTIGALDNQLIPVVIREDVLGHCWDGNGAVG